MKKETWKTVIQIVISILTAIATSLGVTSCMKPHTLITKESPLVSPYTRGLNLFGNNKQSRVVNSITRTK